MQELLVLSISTVFLLLSMNTLVQMATRITFQAKKHVQNAVVVLSVTRHSAQILQLPSQPRLIPRMS